MGLSSTDKLTIALSAIFGTFFFVAVAIIAHFLRKHHRDSVALTTRFQRLRSDSTSRRTPHDIPMMLMDVNAPMIGQTDVDSHVLALLPPAVALLRSCRELARRLLAQLVESASHTGSDLVTGSMDDVLAASSPISARADHLTTCMYPPIMTPNVIDASTRLVASVDQLVRVTRENCDLRKLAWLDQSATNVIDDYKRLCAEADRVERSPPQTVSEPQIAFTPVA